jgi:hypothetical protein
MLPWAVRFGHVVLALCESQTCPRACASNSKISLTKNRKSNALSGLRVDARCHREATSPTQHPADPGVDRVSGIDATLSGATSKAHLWLEFARRGLNPFRGLANSACCQRRCSHTSSKSSAARSPEPGRHRPRGWRSSRPHGGTFGTRLRESGRRCAACGRASWARSQRSSDWVPSARPPSLAYRGRSAPWSSPKALTPVHPLRTERFVPAPARSDTIVGSTRRRLSAAKCLWSSPSPEHVSNGTVKFSSIIVRQPAICSTSIVTQERWRGGV